jgi:two-component system, sensor histidine kinase PdtaS
VPSLADRFGRLSTGIKMLSIITLALLPLGLIALFASLAATRTADLQRSADLRVALTESSRKLSAELAADVSAMRRAADSVAEGTPPEEVCARLSAIFATLAVYRSSLFSDLPAHHFAHHPHSRQRARPP